MTDAEDVSYGNASTNQLAFSAKPLALRNERNSVTFLMDCEIASVAKHNRVGVFALSIVTDCALAVLLFPSTSRLTVDRSS